uniref:Uncharacterized protein n=1 Tax=Arundo donax TaxID=35708 RepID=A0A0A9DSM1_ARUDO
MQKCQRKMPHQCGSLSEGIPMESAAIIPKHIPI